MAMYELPRSYLDLYFRLLWAKDYKGVDILEQFPEISRRTKQRYVKDLLSVVDPDGVSVFACNGETIWLTKKHLGKFDTVRGSW